MEKFNAMRTRLLQHLQKKTTWFKSIVALTCLLLTSASAFAQTKTVTSRITAEGQGVGDMFTEPDWNRVSICTIED